MIPTERSLTPVSSRGSGTTGTRHGLADPVALASEEGDEVRAVLRSTRLDVDHDLDLVICEGSIVAICGRRIGCPAAREGG